MKALDKLIAAGLTRRDIADTCEITRQAVGHWFRGRGVPNEENRRDLRRLADKHGIVLLATDFEREREAA